ncbi:unnamed protein product [Brassica oleracea]|uniref:Uncharacterized protein n=1 Tax=Brassica oleracea TaxID=3712 RepID=A0A3P6G0X4_BRAOL|nr:unnamed protein product [Brassica oleracea]
MERVYKFYIMKLGRNMSITMTISKTIPWWNELSQCGKEGLSVLPLMRGALLFWSMKPHGSLDPSNLSSDYRKRVD